MLKKVLVLFGMVAAFVGNAGAALTPVDGCYFIGTADEFAVLVNGVEGNKGYAIRPISNPCAKLTADIQYQRSNGSILNADRTGLRDTDGNVPSHEWPT